MVFFSMMSKKTAKIIALCLQKLSFAIIKIMLALVYLILISLLTVYGLRQELSSKYQYLLEILTQTTGTIIAIFFSLIIIPINQIATKYSPRFLKFLIKNPFLLIAFLFAVCSLIYDVLFLFLGASKLIAITAIILFFSLIILVRFLLIHIVKLSNPYNSIIQPTAKEIVGAFKKNIRRKHHTISDEPDEKAVLYIKNSLLPVREIAIKAVRNLDVELVKNCIHTISTVTAQCIRLRKNYGILLINLLFEIYSMIFNVTSNSLIKSEIHNSLVENYLEISLFILDLKKNEPIRPFSAPLFRVIEGLENLCLFNLQEETPQVSKNACEALSKICVELINIEDYINKTENLKPKSITYSTANKITDIVKKLEVLGTLVVKEGGDKFTYLSQTANQGIMDIYVTIVSIGIASSFMAYRYDVINEVIDEILGKFPTQKWDQLSDCIVLYPFIGYPIKPFSGLSRISEHGIFNEKLKESSLKNHLHFIEANLESLRRFLKKLPLCSMLESSTTEEVYRIVINLLSYLENRIGEDRIKISKKRPVINGELISIAEKLILNALSIFKGKNPYPLFAIYLILLYEYKICQNQKLKKLFEKTHELLISLSHKYKSSKKSKANDDYYFDFKCSIESLVSILKKNNLTNLALDLDLPEPIYPPFGNYDWSMFSQKIYMLLKQISPSYFSEIERVLLEKN